MRIAKERMSSLKSGATTKGHVGIPATAKSPAQMRGRTGMKNASGNIHGRMSGRKSSGKRGTK